MSLHSVLALLQAKSADETPLFADDTAGVVKVLVGYLVLLISFIGSLWVFLRGDLVKKDADTDARITREVEALNQQVNGVGARVDELHTSSTRTETDVNNLKGRQSVFETELTHVGKANARAEAQLAVISVSLASTKEEIMAAINGMSLQQVQLGASTNERIAKLEGTVGTVAEMLATARDNNNTRRDQQQHGTSQSHRG